MKLRVHNPCNQHTKYYRNYNLFWDELTIELNKKHEVIENRFFEKANQKRFEVHFDSLTSESGLHLLECEYVIENIENGEFYILSVSDIVSQAMLVEQNNPKLKKVLISQFVDYELKHHLGDNISKYSPWIYFQQDLTDLEDFYEKRKSLNKYIEKLCFWGRTDIRPILDFFDSKILEGPNYLGDSSKYFTNLICYEVALSVAGIGELCYRDIECFALGIPILRFEYQSSLFQPLIPNYHYISVDYDETIPYHNDRRTDRLGNQSHAKKLEKRFMEVIKDKEFLNFVSNNARDYYLNNLVSPNRVKNTLQILGL